MRCDLTGGPHCTADLRTTQPSARSVRLGEELVLVERRAVLLDQREREREDDDGGVLAVGQRRIHDKRLRNGPGPPPVSRRRSGGGQTRRQNRSTTTIARKIMRARPWTSRRRSSTQRKPKRRLCMQPRRWPTPTWRPRSGNGARPSKGRSSGCKRHGTPWNRTSTCSRLRLRLCSSRPRRRHSLLRRLLGRITYCKDPGEIRSLAVRHSSRKVRHRAAHDSRRALGADVVGVHERCSFEFFERWARRKRRLSPLCAAFASVPN